MEHEDLVSLTADIVAAHVANNNVAVGDVGALVAKVHEALSGLGRPEEAPIPEKRALVSVRASVKPDYLVCMECGSKQKMLKRHLTTAHELTPQQYRADHGLPRDYPMVAPNYSEQRRALAQSIGLGRKRAEPAAAGAAKTAGRGKARGARGVPRRSRTKKTGG